MLQFQKRTIGLLTHSTNHHLSGAQLIKEVSPFSRIRNLNSVLAAIHHWISIEPSECNAPIITYFLKVHFNVAFHEALGLRSGPNSAGYISSLSTRVLDVLLSLLYIPVNTHCSDGGESITV
jgi:hypothetical protein